MIHLFTAVAQAAADTADTVANAMPALPKGLQGMPREVWEKLDADQAFVLLDRAVRPSGDIPAGVHGLIALLIPFAGIALSGFAIWLFVKLIGSRSARKHEEAMAMIEKGIYPPPAGTKAYGKERYLGRGILLAAVGLAFLLSFALVARGAEWLAVSGLLFLVPGLGSAVFYAVLAKKDKREPEHEVSKESARSPDAPEPDTESA